MSESITLRLAAQAIATEPDRELYLDAITAIDDLERRIEDLEARLSNVRAELSRSRASEAAGY